MRLHFRFDEFPGQAQGSHHTNRGHIELSRAQAWFVRLFFTAVLVAALVTIYQACFQAPTMLVPSPDLLPKAPTSGHQMDWPQANCWWSSPQVGRA